MIKSGRRMKPGIMFQDQCPGQFSSTGAALPPGQGQNIHEPYTDGQVPVHPGWSHEWATLNYTMFRLYPNLFLTVRNELFDDCQGQRTGYATLVRRALGRFDVVAHVPSSPCARNSAMSIPAAPTAAKAVPPRALTKPSPMTTAPAGSSGPLRWTSSTTSNLGASV
jgi:hypothetical protein